MNGNNDDGGIPTPERPTGMGEPGNLHADPRPGNRAREAVGEKLEETAGRVRELGDRAAARNRILAPTRPLAYDAARGIDNAADYFRSRELEAIKSDVETQVRRHPIASMAVAFLAGYTLRRIFW